METDGENETQTSVQVATVYSSSSILLAEKGSGETAKEKLKKGDVIYSVNNELITSVSQLSDLLESYTKGTAVTLEIHRTIPAETEEDEPAKQILTGKIILDVRGKLVYRSTPNYVQGITFSGDRTIFSCSYGRNSTKKRFLSELQVYNRAGVTDDTMLGELELAVALPPMVEEVEVVGDEIYMIFESAATTYLEGTDGKGQSTCPIDKMIAVKLELDSIK